METTTLKDFAPLYQSKHDFYIATQQLIAEHGLQNIRRVRKIAKVTEENFKVDTFFTIYRLAEKKVAAIQKHVKHTLQNELIHNDFEQKARLVVDAAFDHAMSSSSLKKMKDNSYFKNREYIRKLPNYLQDQLYHLTRASTSDDFLQIAYSLNATVDLFINAFRDAIRPKTQLVEEKTVMIPSSNTVKKRAKLEGSSRSYPTGVKRPRTKAAKLKKEADYYSPLANVLREMIFAKGYVSVETFCKEAGLSHSYLDTLSRGQIKQPRKSSIMKLAKAFDMSYHELQVIILNATKSL